MIRGRMRESGVGEEKKGKKKTKRENVMC